MTLFDEASQAGMSVIPDVTHPQRSHRVSASAWGDFAVVGACLSCERVRCVLATKGGIFQPYGGHAAPGRLRRPFFEFVCHSPKLISEFYNKLLARHRHGTGAHWH